MSEIKVRIKVNTSELDQANEKAELLVETLKKAKSLVDELAGRTQEKTNYVTSTFEPIKLSPSEIAQIVVDRLKKEVRF